MQLMKIELKSIPTYWCMFTSFIVRITLFCNCEPALSACALSKQTLGHNPAIASDSDHGEVSAECWLWSCFVWYSWIQGTNLQQGNIQHANHVDNTAYEEVYILLVRRVNYSVWSYIVANVQPENLVIRNLICRTKKLNFSYLVHRENTKFHILG